jgi:Fic family protein
MFQPTYHITTKMLKNVAAIEAAREVIANAHLVPAWERQFRDEAVVRQVYHATHIEGNALSLDQAIKVLDGQKILAKDRDIQEIINYRNVIKYINEHQIPRISEASLLHIHKLVIDKILPPDQAGAYRQVQVAIVNNQTRQVVFRPPNAALVGQQIAEFFTWLNKPETVELPAALKAGLSHYELVRIHPFVDGNGRTARIIAMLILYQDGYDVRRFFCLDEYYDQDAARYYAALQSANLSRDLTDWLDYFIEGLAIEFSRIKDRVLELSHDHALKERLGQVALNDRQIVLIKYVEEHGQITNADWKGLVPSVSDDTILRDIKDMMKKRLLKKRGKTKAACYVMR